MAHTAELIAVGTELLLGNIVNTNAQELSEALSGLGINVFWHTVVGDNPLRLKDALEIARKRADIIITTGGLGPTYDDLTKQNSMIHMGWAVYRWPVRIMQEQPERVKDELRIFLGSQPQFRAIADYLPTQRGRTFQLKEHQQEALDDPASVTYLVIDEHNEKLLAALTLSCSAIFLSRKQQLSTLMSAIEVVYFAVDVDYQGLRYRPGDKRSLSHYLFSYLIEMMREISRKHVGAAKIVLYSVPDAWHFYARLGFVPFAGEMYGDRGTFVRDCVPMYFDLN